MTTARSLASAVALVAAPAAAFAQGPATAAFVDVTLIRMDRDRVEPGHTVIVLGDRVVAIGRTGDLIVPAGAAVIDGSGRYLLPGLTDSHVHLATDMPWAPTRTEFGDAPLYLAHGVTTVVNLRGTPDQLQWKRRVESGDLVAPTIYTAGEFVNEPRVHTPEDVRREVAGQARAGYDLIKFHEIWTPRGGFSTRQGLARDAYDAMFAAAHDAGLQVVGHVPVHLGLGAVLASSGGAVAHVGELNRLHFVLGPRVLLASGAMMFVLIVAVAGWGAAAALGRRHRRAAPPPAALRRAQVLFASALAMAMVLFVAGFVIGPGGRFYTSPAWRMGAFASGVLFVMLAGLAIASSFLAWREATVAVRSKMPLAVAAIASAVLAGLVIVAWLPFVWKSSDRAIGRMAARFREAGIAVQSTLVVYEAATPEGSEDVLADPGFRRLDPRTQTLWRQVAERRASQPDAGVLMPPRLPEFLRGVAATFQRNGVLVLAGTDAMGVPLVPPGSSLIRELRLLQQGGLAPYDALRTATVNPARFLGKDQEFGTIAVGARADLLLLERNPLESLEALNDPAGVMVRGHWLPRDRIQAELAALR
jgi:imidazolonepropionase-like amidohydrolase